MVSLHMEGLLAGESFAVSRNQLALLEAVLPGSVRPQIIKHQKYRKKQNRIHLTVKNELVRIAC